MEIQCEWIVLPGGIHKQGPSYVTVKDGVITAISQESSGISGLKQLSTHLLVPGFVDMHTHGVGEWGSTL